MITIYHEINADVREQDVQSFFQRKQAGTDPTPLEQELAKVIDDAVIKALTEWRRAKGMPDHSAIRIIQKDLKGE